MIAPTALRGLKARRLLTFYLLAVLCSPLVAQAQTQVPAWPYWAATLHGWVTAMLALMATVVSLACGQHPRERPASFLVGMMLSWVVLRAAAAPGAAGLKPLLMTLLVLCAVQYLLRRVNWQRSWLDHALLIQCLVVPASLLITGAQVDLLGVAWHVVL
ncbi:MAG: hypothetical protein V3V71_04585, partial [Roseateles sp.]